MRYKSNHSTEKKSLTIIIKQVILNALLSQRSIKIYIPIKFKKKTLKKYKIDYKTKSISFRQTLSKNPLFENFFSHFASIVNNYLNSSNCLKTQLIEKSTKYVEEPNATNVCRITKRIRGKESQDTYERNNFLIKK